MFHRLPVFSFLLAAFLTTASAVAQVPTGTAGSSLVATARCIFVLHDGVLFKFDQETLALLGSVDLDAARSVPAVSDRPRGVPGHGHHEPEIAEVEVVETEVVEEEPMVDVPEPRRAVPGGAAGRAVDAALKWLTAHQDEDGKWDADQFMKHDVSGVPCTGPGNPTKDVGVTGLALLALLGDGNTLRTGPHRDAVKRAVTWLRNQQHENGLIGTNTSHDFIYGHAIATLALSEAYGLSRYKLLRPTVQNAINYLESHRNPYSVWRYQPRDNDNDTSVTTWAVMAYCSARSFGIDVNAQALKIAATWYDQVTGPNGRAGYTKAGELSSRMPGDHAQRFPPENGEAMTAAALYARFLLDQDPKSVPIMKASADLLLAKPPQWKDGFVDPYYWWFGSQAMYQMGGRYWNAWRGLRGIAEHQRRDGNFAGSWDPVGVWDMDGGRVYCTAMHTLTLELDRRIAAVQR